MSYIHSILLQANTSDSNGLEYVTHLQDFFNDAWNKLIWFVSIIGGIIAFVVGIVVPYFQNKRLKLEEKRLEEKFNLAIDAAVEKIKKQIDAHIKEESEKLNNDLQRSTNKSHSFGFFLQGYVAEYQKDHSTALCSYLKSILSSLKGNDSMNTLMPTFTNASNAIEQSKRKSIQRAMIQFNIDSDRFFKELVESDTESRFKEQIEKLKEKLDGKLLS